VVDINLVGVKMKCPRMIVKMAWTYDAMLRETDEALNDDSWPTPIYSPFSPEFTERMKQFVKSWNDEEMKKRLITPKLKNKEIKTAMLGRGTGREGTGGAAKCVCPKCGYEMAHASLDPCNTNKCPKCGTTMTGKGAPGEVK